MSKQKPKITGQKWESWTETLRSAEGVGWTGVSRDMMMMFNDFVRKSEEKGVRRIPLFGNYGIVVSNLAEIAEKFEVSEIFICFSILDVVAR